MLEFTKRSAPPKHRGRNAKREALGLFLAMSALGLALVGLLALLGSV